MKKYDVWSTKKKDVMVNFLYKQVDLQTYLFTPFQRKIQVTYELVSLRKKASYKGVGVFALRCSPMHDSMRNLKKYVEIYRELFFGS